MLIKKYDNVYFGDANTTLLDTVIVYHYDIIYLPKFAHLEAKKYELSIMKFSPLNYDIE